MFFREHNHDQNNTLRHIQQVAVIYKVQERLNWYHWRFEESDFCLSQSPSLDEYLIECILVNRLFEDERTHPFVSQLKKHEILFLPIYQRKVNRNTSIISVHNDYRIRNFVVPLAGEANERAIVLKLK